MKAFLVTVYNVTARIPKVRVLALALRNMYRTSHGLSALTPSEGLPGASAAAAVAAVAPVGAAPTLHQRRTFLARAHFPSEPARISAAFEDPHFPDERLRDQYDRLVALNTISTLRALHTKYYKAIDWNMSAFPMMVCLEETVKSLLRDVDLDTAIEGPPLLQFEAGVYYLSVGQDAFAAALFNNVFRSAELSEIGDVRSQEALVRSGEFLARRAEVQGRLAEAEALYRSVLDLAPGANMTATRLASILFESGRLSEAATFASRGIHMEPNFDPDKTVNNPYLIAFNKSIEARITSDPSIITLAATRTSGNGAWPS